MKFIYTKHAIRDKFPALKRLGWKVTKSRVESTVKHPKWHGVSKHGDETAMSLVDDKHILRVVFNREDDIINILNPIN